MGACTTVRVSVRAYYVLRVCAQIRGYVFVHVCVCACVRVCVCAPTPVHTQKNKPFVTKDSVGRCSWITLTHV